MCAIIVLDVVADGTTRYDWPLGARRVVDRAPGPGRRRRLLMALEVPACPVESELVPQRMWRLAEQSCCRTCVTSWPLRGLNDLGLRSLVQNCSAADDQGDQRQQAQEYADYVWPVEEESGGSDEGEETVLILVSIVVAVDCDPQIYMLLTYSVRLSDSEKENTSSLMLGVTQRTVVELR